MPKDSLYALQIGLKHVAIIPDGNHRWAAKHNVSTVKAYAEGVNIAERVITRAQELGIPYITMYMMSLENVQKRSSTWRKTFFAFLERTLERYCNNNQLKDVRILAIGDLSNLPDNLRVKICEVVESTAGNMGITLVVAIAYTGRDEIVRAINKCINAQGRAAGGVTADMLEKHLDTAGIPPPDLLIRTSGEMRLSGFLLWQLAYTEFLFVNELWPDFSVERLDEAVAEFHKRTRNFGSERSSRGENHGNWATVNN
ncbi:MAG: di-trans,poly-cis-decaprenylcistransferase [Holosporales bacterium]|jgi:undecaprenyl diphosphate synthase|nr:di-trans,poly-cis-decaprenylcistransferase [Holosporales bacterium]